MSRRISFLLSLLALFLTAKPLLSQRLSSYDQYIKDYSEMAVGQMLKYKVPASITLAQALIESGAGKSRLATKANNHFGIKCSGNWRGPYILVDDDRPNEKFRVYRSAYESYEDHSLFLRNNRRYAFLFKLKRTDYKSWAKGLKKAGYATNPRYSTMLINIIERYDLDQYDKEKHSYYKKEHLRPTHLVHKYNKNYYVIAKEGDTYKSIGKEMGVSERRLRSYNEVDKHAVLRSGDIVYMEKKQKKAEAQFKGYFHKVQPGESMYLISQMYGIRLKTLYKNNHLSSGYSIKVGDLLLIR